MQVRAKAASAVIAAAVLGGTVAVSVPSASAHHKGQIQHVLLISVDGMHQSDLNWYIANNPTRSSPQLASGGAEFTNNHTSDPSDSDPGGTALMTGGDPRATGVYYDVEYSHAVDEAGAACKPGQPATGGDVIYDSPDDTLNAVPDLLNNGSGNTFPSFDEGGSIYPGGLDTNPGADHEPVRASAVGPEPGELPGRPDDL